MHESGLRKTIECFKCFSTTKPTFKILPIAQTVQTMTINIISNHISILTMGK